MAGSCFVFPARLSRIAGLLPFLFGCDDIRAPLSCSAFFATGERPGWQLDEEGIAQHLDSGTRWYRCPAGMVWAANRCHGEPLRTDWDSANAYAEEFSTKSGRRWSLPSNAQFGDIQEQDCNNPSINPQVLGGLDVDNYWTSTRTLHNDVFRCTLYTYGGQIDCRENRAIPHPFFLILE